jgi:inner membrane protein involved in colicin E2 resistance
MSTYPATLPPTHKPDTRAMGTKLIVITILALLMSIPTFWIDTLTDQRTPPPTATTQIRTLFHTSIPTVDSYRSVTRSLKYVLLFLGLVFLTYFVFEAHTRKRVHPAQYVLVGTAQLIFYLLLLSLSEKLGFDAAFLLAGTATVTLLALNAAWTFTRTQGTRAAIIFTLLYTQIYILLRLQNDALLIGAISAFAAVAATMYLTRNIDWYTALPGSAKPAA